MAKTGVFLLDDHEVVRQGLSRLIDAQDDMQVVGEAGTAAEALSRVPAVRPDVAVLDVRLPDGNGVEVCRDLRSAMPELRCLMLTSFADDEAMFDAIMVGAAGYVLKEIRSGDLSRRSAPSPRVGPCSTRRRPPASWSGCVAELRRTSGWRRSPSRRPRFST